VYQCDDILVHYVTCVSLWRTRQFGGTRVTIYGAAQKSVSFWGNQSQNKMAGIYYVTIYGATEMSAFLGKPVTK
jgi:hypothetical protein